MYSNDSSYLKNINKINNVLLFNVVFYIVSVRECLLFLLNTQQNMPMCIFYKMSVNDTWPISSNE